MGRKEEKGERVERGKKKKENILCSLNHFIFREILESIGDDTLALSFPKCKNIEFTAFAMERDHVGNILSVFKNFKLGKKIKWVYIYI